MDGVRGSAVLVATDRQRLSDMTFLDGRETFWSSQTLVPIRLAPCTGPPMSRFVFHAGFCGSTLLARLLGLSGDALVLKEPQCLADIAGQRELIVSGRAIASLDALLDYALCKLDEAGDTGRLVVVKPTNWVNSLLPQLCHPKRGVRAVFLGMDRRSFTRAVFRGNRARIEFSIRLAAQLAAIVPDGEKILVAAIAQDDNPLDRAARIAGLLHAFQERLFEQMIATNGWSDEVRITLDDLVQRPEATLRRTRMVLGLAQQDNAPQRAALMMSRNAKDPLIRFHPADRHQEDREMERHHGVRFDAALDWVDSYYPSAPD